MAIEAGGPGPLEHRLLVDGRIDSVAYEDRAKPRGSLLQ